MNYEFLLKRRKEIELKISSVSLSSDGSLIACAAGTFIAIYDTEHAAPLFHVEGADESTTTVESMKWSRRDNTLHSSWSDGGLIISTFVNRQASTTGRRPCSVSFTSLSLDEDELKLGASCLRVPDLYILERESPAIMKWSLVKKVSLEPPCVSGVDKTGAYGIRFVWPSKEQPCALMAYSNGTIAAWSWDPDFTIPPACQNGLYVAGVFTDFGPSGDVFSVFKNEKHAQYQIYPLFSGVAQITIPLISGRRVAKTAKLPMVFLPGVKGGGLVLGADVGSASLWDLKGWRLQTLQHKGNSPIESLDVVRDLQHDRFIVVMLGGSCISIYETSKLKIPQSEPSATAAYQVQESEPLGGKSDTKPVVVSFKYPVALFALCNVVLGIFLGLTIRAWSGAA